MSIFFLVVLATSLFFVLIFSCLLSVYLSHIVSVERCRNYFIHFHFLTDGIIQPWRDSPVWDSQVIKILILVFWCCSFKNQIIYAQIFAFWFDFQTLEGLKDFIRSFQPKADLNVPEVNILLVGQVGAGKSSVVNTINSIWKGEISTRSWAGSSDHSLTASVCKFLLLSYINRLHTEHVKFKVQCFPFN